MKNLTIAVDEDVLRDARIEALHQKTSVNRMLAEYLAEIGGRRKRQAEAIREIREIMTAEGAEIDPRGYTRDELYERY